MPDIYLYQGEATPEDIRLTDPTQVETGGDEVFLTTGGLSLSAPALTVLLGIEINLSSGYLLAGSYGLKVSRPVILDTGVLLAAGESITIAQAVHLDTGILTVAGHATVPVQVGLDSGVLTVDGGLSEISIDLIIQLDTGALTLTGPPIVISYARFIDLDSGVLTLGGGLQAEVDWYRYIWVAPEEPTRGITYNRVLDSIIDPVDGHRHLNRRLPTSLLSGGLDADKLDGYDSPGGFGEAPWLNADKIGGFHANGLIRPFSGAKLQKSANQSIYSAWLSVTWQTVIWDTSSYYNGTYPERLTVPEDGFYVWNFTVYTSQHPGHASRGYMNMSGSDVAWHYQNMGSPSIWVASHGAWLKANDYVYFQVYAYDTAYKTYTTGGLSLESNCTIERVDHLPGMSLSRMMGERIP